MKDLQHEIHILGVRRGPLRGHVGAMLGSSWHLKGILTPLINILATEVDIRGGGSLLGGGVDMAPGGPWEGDLGGGINGSKTSSHVSRTPMGQRPREFHVSTVSIQGHNV